MEQESLQSFGDEPASEGVDPGVMLPERVSAIELPDGYTAEALVTVSKADTKQFEQYIQQVIPVIEQNWRIYENKETFGFGDNAAIIPLGTSIVDTQQARGVSSILAQEKYVDAVPRGVENTMAEDADEKTSKVEDLINESIKLTDDFNDKIDTLYQNMLIERVMIAEVKMMTKKETSLRASQMPNPMTGAMEVTEAELEEYDCQKPDFEPVSMRYLGWEPRAINKLWDAAYVFRKKKISLDEGYQMEQDGVIENFEQAVRTPSAAGDGAANDQSDPQARQIQNVEGRQLPKESGPLSLVEWWAVRYWQMPAGEDGTPGQRMKAELNYWMIGDTLVRCKPNPYGGVKPFILCKQAKKADEIVAQGPIDVVKPILRNLAYTVKAWNDLTVQVADNPIFFEPTTMLSARKTILQSSNLVPVLSTEGIKRMEPPTQAIRLLQERINFLIGQAREATAANEQAQGISEGSDTATEAQILQASASLRTQYTANMVASNFFAWLGWFYYKLYQRLGTPENMIIHEAGTDGRPVALNIADMAGDYSFKPVLATSQGSKNQRFKLLKDMLTGLMSVPGLVLTDDQGQVMEPNTYEFLTKELLPLVDISGAQRLFRVAPPKPVMPGMPMEGGPIAPDGSGGGMAEPLPPMEAPVAG